MEELIIFHQTKGIVMHPEALKLSKYLGKIKPQDLQYIHLAHDYHSVLKQFPQVEKQRRAKHQVYGEKTDYEPEEDKKLKLAIDEYKSLQYDSDRETIENYRTKVALMNTLFLAETDPGKIKKFMDTIDDINQRLKTMQTALDMQEKQRRLKGDGTLSLIEKWQLRKLKYINDKRVEKQTTGIVYLD